MSGSPHPAATPWRLRLDVPDGVHSLLGAVTDIGRGLDLPQVVQSIVEAAADLTGVEYDALAGIGDGHRLSQFLPVGIPDDLAGRIRQAPAGAADWAR